MTDAALSADGGRTIGLAPAGARPRLARSLAWLGVVPFFSFLVLFLFVPALSVFQQALHNGDGTFGFGSMAEAFRGQNRAAFAFSIRFSAVAALIGTVVGTLLAYAAASLRRPRWLRNLISSFSGVAANLGGLPLAFAFVTLIGRQGVLTKILAFAGWDLYAGSFELGSVPGLVTIYAYFNIPLMVLVTLPAIDGLKPSWREANANLGGTTWTYWRRVGVPVLTPSLLGGFLLLFANSFSAYATAAAVTDNSRIVPLRLAFFLGGDIKIGADSVGYSLAGWMIIIMAVAMGVYWVARKRAERWQV